MTKQEHHDAVRVGFLGAAGPHVVSGVDFAGVIDLAHQSPYGYVMIGDEAVEEEVLRKACTLMGEFVTGGVIHAGRKRARRTTALKSGAAVWAEGSVRWASPQKGVLILDGEKNVIESRRSGSPVKMLSTEQARLLRSRLHGNVLAVFSKPADSGPKRAWVHDLGGKMADIHRVIELSQPAPERRFRHATPDRIEAFRKLRQQFVSDNTVYSGERLGKLLGRSSPSNPYQWAVRKRKEGELLGLFEGGRYLYPALQIDGASGKPYPCMKKLIEWFDAKEDGWRLAFWLTQPHGMLDGQSPSELLGSSPDRVLDAAEATLFTARA